MENAVTAADLYLRAVIAMHRVPETADATPHRIRRMLFETLRRWGGGHLEAVTVSGSYAKGTAIRNPALFPSGVDVDLFLSLAPDAPGALADWHESLIGCFRDYQPQPANVAVRILVDNTRVDLVAARRRHGGSDHTLWQHRRATWLRTNIVEQARIVRVSGCLDEILAMKIWRRGNGLYFPSFCLELAVIHALAAPAASAPLSAWFLDALEFLATDFPATPLLDPTNASNVVSDVMTLDEKHRVSHAARLALAAPSWPEILPAPCLGPACAGRSRPAPRISATCAERYQRFGVDVDFGPKKLSGIGLSSLPTLDRRLR